MNDLKFAFRQLLKNPGFTAVVVSTLAVAIGATTAIVSVVQNTIIDPLPVPNADRLMSIESFNVKRDHRWAGVNAVTIAEFRKTPDVFADLVVYSHEQKVYRGGESTELLQGATVSPDYFSLWQVAPLLGRVFAADEDRSSAEQVMILSHRFWRSKLSSDPDVIGRTIQFGDGSEDSPFQDYTVVGVMPKHFAFPHEHVNFWIPGFDPDLEVAHLAPGLRIGIWLPSYPVAFRLPEGVTRDRAQVIVDALSARHGLEEPRIKDWRMRVHPVSEEFTDEATRNNLWMLLAVVLLVWLIACANVANLLVARAEGRQHEMAMRGALGANRMRLIRQLLTECLLLSMLGGLCGLVLTAWGIHTLDAFLGGARMKPLGLSLPVFASSMMVAMVTGIVFGLAPAWRASRARPVEVLRQTGSGMSQSLRGRLFVRGLIVGEVALSVVILAVAGLMVRSVIQVLNVDVGYRSEGLLRVMVIPPSERYPLGNHVAHETLYNRLIEQFAALPGVASVGTMNHWSRTGEYVADRGGPSLRLEREGCGIGDQNLFRTLETPLLDGRFLEGFDRGRSTVVINKTLAEVLWPGQRAVGRRFHNQNNPTEEWEVAGVVGDLKLFAYDSETPPTFFRLSEEAYGRGNPTYFFVRSAGDPASLVRPIQRAIKEMEPDVIDHDIRIMSEELHLSTQSRRAYTLYVALLAGVGLTLAMIGLYGLMAYAVARRTREIGIRKALGACRRHVVGMVIHQGVRLTGMGVVLGLIVAAGVTRSLRNLLFGIEPIDPATFLLTSLITFVVAGVACWLPAHRAATIHPMEALRNE